MYALTVLLSLIASAAFARMVAFEDDRRPWAIGFAVAFAAMLYTHNWALFFGAACGAAWLFLLFRARGPERRDLLINGAIGFGGAVLLYLPWIPITLYQAAHTGAPWARGADRGQPARRARADARPARADRAAAGGRRRPGGPVRAPRGPAVAARPRGRLPARDLGHDRAAGVGRLAGIARVGRPLSRVGGRPAAARRRRRARQRGQARDRRPRGRGRAGRGRHGARRQEQRARSRRRDRAQPGARRPRRLHPARAGAGARVLPAGRPAVRDAHRRGARHRRHRLARRAGAARRDLRRARPRPAARPR